MQTQLRAPGLNRPQFPAQGHGTLEYCWNQRLLRRSEGSEIMRALSADLSSSLPVAQCLLVIIGATPEGKKELVGLIDGVRESVQSWRELLLDLRRRGLSIGPEL